MEKNKSYDVFLSYRRADGWVAARLLYEKLTGEGLTVFLDVECLGNVDFCAEIEKAIETSTYFISVLSSSSSSASASIDRCKNKDDMVLKEIAHAYKHKTEDKIITAAFSNFVFPPDLPPELQKHMLKNAVTFNEILHFKYDLQKLYEYLPETNININRAYLKNKTNKFYHEFDQANELERLKKQFKLLERNDKDVYDKVLNQYKDKIDVLDIGCSDGVKTFGCFGIDKVKSIFGIDVNTQCLEKAKQNSVEYQNKGIACTFEALNLECENLEEELAKILKDKKFHIIHVSYVLLHISNPQKVLSCLRDYLTDDGTIIIIDVDDSLNVCYPDKDGEYKQFDEIGDSIASLYGNRYTGRKIYTFLVDAYYENIRLEQSLSTNIGYSRRERAELFEIWNSWVKDRISIAYEENPNDPLIRKNKKFIDEKYYDMKEKFINENFFFGCGTMIFTAHKSK